MSRIYINKQESHTEAATVSELAISLDLPERGVAVAVNNRIVPKAEWSSTALREDDQVTIIKAAFGG
ncbi:MAG: sulfur carrier protein ThiS [Bacteroidales bacterium]|nr:sulfur carrier protein ThiS [Candidatus Cryptobacteroides equifaecalis]